MAERLVKTVSCRQMFLGQRLNPTFYRQRRKLEADLRGEREDGRSGRSQRKYDILDWATASQCGFNRWMQQIG